MKSTAKTPLSSKGSTTRSVSTSESKQAAAAAPLKIVAFLNMGDHTSQMKSSVPLDQPLFSARPSEITFRECDPSQAYSVDVVLKNQDTVRARPLTRVR